MPNKKLLIKKLTDNQCLITPESYELLEELDESKIDIEKIVDHLKDELVITIDKLNSALTILGFIPTKQIPDNDSLKTNSSTTQQKEGSIQKKTTDILLDKNGISKLKAISKDELPSFDPISKNIKHKIKILHESSGKTTIEGDIADFKKYFASRFNQLKTILQKRGDISNSIKIADLEKAKINAEDQITFIGIVTEKHPIKSGGIILEIEDPSGHFSFTVTTKMQELLNKVGILLEDQVAAFTGRFYENTFLLDDFIFPDVPIVSNKHGIEDPISVCMTSDLHIGSKEFLEDSFLDFIDFLNGRIDDPYQQNLAGQIKYLIINGDIVDGIGIYPKQEEELLITDIYEQYKRASYLLSKIPNWIQIIIVSGNHDACRLALPQPAINKEYALDLWKMNNVTMLSNPSTIELHNRIFLLYHGNSFEDIAALAPGISLNDPNGAMLYTLRYRHLAPTFGRRSSIVPSKKDELVIETVPQIYHTGHIHINSHTQYRGIDCINSGTFQAQTEYMLSKNITPTPGHVPIINLQTNKLHELVFYEPLEIKK